MRYNAKRDFDMMDTKMTIEQIETVLACYSWSPFYIRQNIVIPNVSWGYLNHEADLLVVTKEKHLIEVEIKRSFQDFLADFKKSHLHQDEKLFKMYYAVPISIAEKVFNFLYDGEYKQEKEWLYYGNSVVHSYKECNTNKAGLIVYGSNEETMCYTSKDIGSAGINVYAQNLGKYKVSKEEEMKLLRLLGLRVWKLKTKLSNIKM